MNGSGLTTFALVFMLLSMGSVTALMLWCFARILRGQKSDDASGHEG